MKILLCNDSYPHLLAELSVALPEHNFVSCAADKVKDYIQSADVVIPSVASIDAEIINSGRFGLIHQIGVGLDPVDINAATAAGVWVANVPSGGSGNAESVAELAVYMMISLARRLDEARKNAESGVFFKPTGMALLNKTACILGFGDIGKALAARLRPFGMRLIVVRQHVHGDEMSEFGVENVFITSQMLDALSTADFVVVALPGTDTTANLIGADAIKSMKRGAFFVNIGRGSIVDTYALVDALESGHVAGAGIDAFVDEPIDPNHPLLKQNVIATPHIGGNTDESIKGIFKVLIKSIQLYAQGKPPVHPVNHPPKIRSQIAL